MVAFFPVWLFKPSYMSSQLEIIKHRAELLIELEECGPCCEDVEVKTTPCFQPVCVCVLFFQSVIVIPLAQSVIAVMAQDFVYVRRALQGQSVRSVYPAICGTMAANVSRTTTPHLPPPQLLTVLPSALSLFAQSLIFFLCVNLELRLEVCAAHVRDSLIKNRANPIYWVIWLTNWTCISQSLRLC